MPIDSNAVWLTVTDFLTPTTLSMADIGQQPEVLKSNPVFFDGSNNVIEQHFAISKDGTKVPYFLVRPKDLAFDGKARTLLYGYGGFEISLTPAYSGAIGKGWLEKGGVYVLANIRGGGEYGPRWHQAALKANRHKAYEDFAAIADDLVARKITSPQHLGTMGGSNGGLLMGNMLTQYPEQVRRDRGAGAAAGHEALQPPAGRCLVDGRIRRSGHQRLGLTSRPSRRITCSMQASSTRRPCSPPRPRMTACIRRMRAR